MRATDSQENQNQIGIRGIGSALGSRKLNLEQLSENGAIQSKPEDLGALGFDAAFLVNDESDLAQLAKTAAENALADADVSPDEIDLLIWNSAIASGHNLPTGENPSSDLDIFRYSGSWLHEALQLDKASVLGIAQQGCAGMFSTIRTARSLLHSETTWQNILCVGVDALPRNASREILSNVISDAAAACVISKDQVKQKWIGFHQITKGYFWDTPARTREITAAYFPTAKATILELLTNHQLTPGAIDLVIPNGIQGPSWPVLLDLVGIPQNKLYINQERFGHTINADNLINLQQAQKDNRTGKGDILLMFTYGFGSSWSAMLLEQQPG